MLRKLLLLATLPLSAQTLARPNWTGNGLTVQPWFTHAVLYTVDPHTYTPEGTLPALTARLDYLRSLGVDALILTHLDPAAPLDELDTLIREATRDNLRVLIELPSAATPAEARLFLSHNAAGLGVPSATPELRALLRSFPGKRILLAPDGDLEADLKADLKLDTTLAAALPDAAALRKVLEALPPATIAQAPATLKPEIAATLLLATQANAQLTAGQELGSAPNSPIDLIAAAKQDADPASLLNWTRSLIDVHHGSSALRSGTPTFLNRDADNALVWVIRRPQVTPQFPALFVLCNLSDKPLKLNLTADAAALHLRGTFLRPVLRYPTGMGGQSLDAVTLPPHGIYLGELRF